MTIRGGAGPRDDRSQAHPADHGTYDDYRPGHDDWQPPQRRRSGGGGPGGVIRFLVFTLVLAGIVLVGLVAVVRPVIGGAILDWAYDNPGSFDLPFVADLVRDDLGPLLTEPASADPTEIVFPVVEGDTPGAIAPRLVEAGVVRDPRAFVFQAHMRELLPKLQAGNFGLRLNMTPDEVVTGLIENRIVITVVPVNFRESLRLEQVTAKLQTLGEPLTLDPQEFYELASNPPPELLAEYPWLAETGRPDGASLEGFLGAATYELTRDTTAGDLVRMMLDQFERSVGTERMAVAESRGMSFYEIVTLASIVEREAVLDEERPLIAGVYQNRLSAGGATSILGADPTVYYALDTVDLRAMPFDDWQRFTFFNTRGVSLQDVTLPDDLAGYHSYQVRGLPPGPICTPSVASIDAALAPDTTDGYLYFLAIPNGGGTHAFAKTQAEHDENRRKYGYL
jgi:UPF0755 protein